MAISFLRVCKLGEMSVYQQNTLAIASMGEAGRGESRSERASEVGAGVAQEEETMTLFHTEVERTHL